MAQKVYNKFGDDIGGFSVRSFVGEEEWPDVYTKYGKLTDNFRMLNDAYYFFAQLSPFPGVVVKKDVALRLGGFTNKLFPIADFDFWYRYSREERMIMVEETMSYYRISSSQSTVDAFYDMINKIYMYRKELISGSKYNNFMTRLGLEYSRSMNIDYFKKTYPAFNAEDNILDREKLEKVRKILKLPLLKGLVWRYMRFLSYSKI
jgi:hypothetical protein